MLLLSRPLKRMLFSIADSQCWHKLMAFFQSTELTAIFQFIYSKCSPNYWLINGNECHINHIILAMNNMADSKLDIPLLKKMNSFFKTFSVRSIILRQKQLRSFQFFASN